jgi:predicted nucleotidyltransferase
MLKKSHEEMLKLFRKDVFLKCSILQLQKKLGKKAYQRVHDAAKELEREGILSIEKTGNSSMVSLLLSPKSVSNMAFLDEQEAEDKKLPNYEKIVSIKELSNYLIMVTGSYASGKQKKSSDMDIVIVIPGNEKPIDVQKLAENLMVLYYPPVHLYAFIRGDFMEMLLEKKGNYGKEIFKNHLILKNARTYYEIIKEAAEHGFKG